ncbi:MAG: type II secretion system F family protein [Candidatus Vogelbacteria bacterium]|nr:type II secretion system F family protein [Candidatus Vogelbacteria bacterium]
MIRFHYKASDAEGKIAEGERDAKDKFELAHDLKKEGLMVFFVEDVTRLRHARGFQYWNERIIRIGLRDKIGFAGNLSAMIGAGLSLSRALGILLKQTKNLRFKRILDDVIKEVNNGSSLNAALEKHSDVFPSVFSAMVEAGEQSGNLPSSLSIVNEQLAKTYQLQKKIRGAMIYPAVIISLMIVIGFLMMIYVVPTLTNTFSQFGTDLPFATRLILNSSKVISDNLVAIMIMLIALIILLVMWVRTNTGRRVVHKIILRLPLIGELSKKTNAATIARTLSSLITSGVDMVQALEITKRALKNVYFRDIIDEAKALVQKGEPLASAFQMNEKVCPILLGEMAEVGEETGKLAEMLMKVAVFYEEEVSQATKDMSTIIEPVLMIIIGLAVGFFAIAIIQPIYSIGNSI